MIRALAVRNWWAFAPPIDAVGQEHGWMHAMHPNARASRRFEPQGHRHEHYDRLRDRHSTMIEPASMARQTWDAAMNIAPDCVGGRQVGRRGGEEGEGWWAP